MTLDLRTMTRPQPIRVRLLVLLLHLPVLMALLPSPATAAPPPAADVRIIDEFEDVSGWSAHPADGVTLAIESDAGFEGRAMRLDVGIPGAGYAVARKTVALDLPESYAFTLYVRGELPPNTLEFKLIDDTGDNVWWGVRRDFEFDGSWQRVTFRKRHITFAWGPLGGGEIHHVAAIELAITAGQGGTGSVWIDQLELRRLPPPDTAPPAPVARASSSREGHGPVEVLDGDLATTWQPAAADSAPWLELDLGSWREFGGLIVDWGAGYASAYGVELADDGGDWRLARVVRGGDGGRDYLPLPEAEAARVRLRIAAAGDASLAVAGDASAAAAAAAATLAIAEIALEPVTWSATPESLFTAIARDAPRGSYPRALSGEQSYWTVVGVDGDRHESLLGEDGALEVWPRGFSIEPFLWTDAGLVTWADVHATQRLAGDALPVPIVRWQVGDAGADDAGADDAGADDAGAANDSAAAAALELEVTAFATGSADSASTVARYRVTNLGATPATPTLFLALRPFQVNPPAQILNVRGGVAPIHAIRFVLESRGVWAVVDGTRAVLALDPPSLSGASTFDGGDIVADHLRRGRLPRAHQVDDPAGAASAAMGFPLVLAPGETARVDVVVPKGAGAPLPPRHGVGPVTHQWVEDAEAGCLRAWDEAVGRVRIDLPPAAQRISESVASQLAFILVNRDGAAIRPGTRAYDRSWIRDGALTSIALLRLGHDAAVRDFIRWYAPYQFASGKVPCVVDDRGADPVPEHDSSGEFIDLVAQYHRYTGDRALVEEQWPRIVAAVAYLDSLRQERRTPEYRAPGQRAFYGLLPPSISHEGYAAKPMHSYWDDFWALRGFRDAAQLAGVLGDSARATRFAAIGEEFADDLGASIEAAMRLHDIDYVPGCADLGDFDATSTTIALAPTATADVVPPLALRRTFERYAGFFRERRRTDDWEAFTPYEVR
ncbi:MAG: discoidin domain-containing protein, partial [Candidatus Eiseniibacteriota bacterium]